MIEPYDLIFQWSNWYVWGWCESRDDFRLFKLRRMTDLQMGDVFEKRTAPLPDLSAEQVFPHIYQVKAKIAPEFEWRLIEEYGPESYTVQPDGSLLFSFGFTDKLGIISWIVSFGDGAELLEPAEFRQEVAAFAQGILEKYMEP